jgi:hypothetical protein
MFETRTSPSIDQLLEAFGRDDVAARHPAMLRRLASTRTRFLAYLATDATHVLTPEERVLLSGERQFSPDGAFSRVFGAEVLMAALPGFLEPAWLPRRTYDARAQVRFVEVLSDWLVAHRFIDRGEMSCFVYDVRAAARAARAFVARRGEQEASASAASPEPASGHGG